MAGARQLCWLDVRAVMTNGGSNGSAVMLARLVRAGSCRRWCGSVKQGTVDEQGEATAAARAKVQAWAQGSEAQGTAEAGRGKQKV